MRLSEFILHAMEDILAEWEAFAATLLPGAAGMSSLALRDHAQPILEAVAADITTPQSRQEQADKSRGRAPQIAGAPETAAQTHAVLRARSGFDINQLVGEYRALRASVLRLWMDAIPLDRGAVEEVIRFNEAIDQAIAESVSHFNAQVEQARNLLLGMLGHDMRNPLNNILMTAQHLAAVHAGDTISVAAERLIRSGASMQALLDDLVDFNRTNLGLGLKVLPAEVDLAASVSNEVDQLQGAHPNRRIELTVSGDLSGRWDGHRVQQTVRNLVLNAFRHGVPDAPVQVSLRGEAEQVVLEVTNSGAAIPASTLSEMFEPLKRGATAEADGDPGLGLGLYIVREITKAHDGRIEVRSEGEETVFTVILPRR